MAQLATMAERPQPVAPPAPAASEKLVWVYYLTITACFMVIFGHVSAGVLLETTDTYTRWVSNIADTLIRHCITLFVMLSGFLLLNPGKNDSIMSFYRKRASRILLPLIFWTLAYTAFATLRKYFTGMPITADGIITPILGGHPFYHLWYLYMLIGLYLVTPFLKKIVAAFSKRQLIYLCGGLFIAAMVVNYVNFIYFQLDFLSDSPFMTWFLYFLGYYFAGYLIAKEPEIRISTKYLVLGLMISFAVTAFGFEIFASKYSYITGYFFYSPLSPSVVLMSLTSFVLAKRYFSKFPNFKYLASFSALGLGIYLVHPIFLILLARLGIEAVKFNAAISIPLVAITVLLLSTGTAWIISKITVLKKTI